MLRIKSTSLHQENNLFFYKNKLFNGITYFIDENKKVLSFHIRNGLIYQPYIPIVIQENANDTAISAIDATDYWYNEHEYDDGFYTLPQEYQGQKYSGIAYKFNQQGICETEAYFGKEGLPLSSVSWKQGMIYDYLFIDKNIDLHSYMQQYNNKNRIPSTHFISLEQSENNFRFILETPEQLFSLHIDENKLMSLELFGLLYRDYPNFNSLNYIDNIYKYFNDFWEAPIFHLFKLRLTKVGEEIYPILKNKILKGDFNRCRFLYIYDLDKIDVIRFFLNKKYLPYLEVITLSTHLKEKINKENFNLYSTIYNKNRVEIRDE